MSVGDQLQCLNNGYVRVAMVAGSDLSVSNAARVSYAKESEELDSKDERLIRFLAKNNHTSPFRHAFMTFEVKAPLMVARQWWKYVVGGDHSTGTGWNEASRRYITMEPEFYYPLQWRKAPENNKQGSDGWIEDGFLNNMLTHNLIDQAEAGMARYTYAMDHGVAPEQARLFLNAYAMYTLWRWSASLQSIAHFLSQRLEDDAQWEIREYAQAVQKLATPHFPVSLEALLG